MNILIIEDNPLKRGKVEAYLNSRYGARMSCAGSYNTGLKLAISGEYDFMILDMSMPTFDRTEATHGGRFRALGGHEIAVRLAKLQSLIPFVVLTGYRDFSVNSQSLSVQQIDLALRSVGDKYKGCILFDAADSVWQDKLSEIIDKEQRCG